MSKFRKYLFENQFIFSHNSTRIISPNILYSIDLQIKIIHDVMSHPRKLLSLINTQKKNTGLRCLTIVAQGPGTICVNI